MAESTYTAPATYTITFPSLSQSEVKVSIDGVLQSSGFTISGYATSGSGTVTFTSAPAAGSTVRVFRDTTILNNQAPAPKADFQSGASIQAADLNNNMDQVLYKLAEKVDEGDISADSVVTQAIRDLNVTTAKIANNAVTAAKIDSNVLTSHATQVTDIANSAATATAAAATATAQATAAATSAANAATEAGTIAGTVATAQAAATAAQAQATASAASAATSASEAAQAATDSGTAITTAQGAVTSANSAVTTANSADTKADTAITTANTADTNATSALSTANTAATAATNAVSTANTASTNATTAVNTANAASATANTADTNASAAVVTANAASATATTADTNASNAVTTANSANATANTANTNAASALTTVNTANTTANTANTTANTALTTANGAVTTANTADTNATNAVSTANSAANAVANAVLYDPIANFAAFPSSPSNLDRIEVLDSTGLQSQSIITGLPASFTGSSDLVVRLEYNSSTSKWQFKQYFAADPEARYIPKPGGTFTGPVNFEDDLIVKGDSTNGSGELTLNCENNSHGIKIKGPPHSAGANYTLTLPNDTGTNGQALITNGSGVSSWSTTVAGRDLSADGSKLDGIETGATADQTKADIDALNINADTLDGQHGSYYTGYTDTAVSNLVDSSPATLDTLNELAAALGDDPNFATTTANNIGTKLPLAGGTLTGNLTLDGTGNGEIFLSANTSGAGGYYRQKLDAGVSGGIWRIMDSSGSDKVLFNADGSAAFTGTVTLQANLDMQDNDKILLGTGDDLQIYHDGSHSRIVDSGTGHLILAGSRIHILNAAQNEILIDAYENGAVELYYDNSKKLATTTTGISVTGQIDIGTTSIYGTGDISMGDNDKLRLGTGDDLQIYHNGSNTYIDNNTGDLYIRAIGDDLILRATDDIYIQPQGSESGIIVYGNASVDLFYDGNHKLATKSDGVNIIGELECDSLDVDGSGTFSGVISDSIGPVRRVGITNTSGTGNLSASDAGKLLRSTGTITLTIPSGTFTAGDMVTIFNAGTGDITIGQGSGTTLHNTADATTGNRTLAAKGMCTIACTASNEFVISGSQLS